MKTFLCFAALFAACIFAGCTNDTPAAVPVDATVVAVDSSIDSAAVVVVDAGVVVDATPHD